MTIDTRFAVWRNPIVELWVPAGRQHKVVHVVRDHLFVWSADHYEWPLSYDSFSTGPSEEEVPSDEIYCPCGKTLEWDGTAGDMLRVIAQHCGTAGHPKPRYEP
jgi:hypothetical protein